MGPVAPSNILGCILAGGLSRRMGGENKAFADLGGTALVAHAAARIAPQVAATIVNANSDPVLFAGLGLPIVSDTIAGSPGPLAGILSGMRYAQEHGRGVSHLVSVATDTPFFPPELVRRLAAATAGSSRIVLAASADRVHSVFGLWPVDLADDLERWLRTTERRSVRAFAEDRGMTTVHFEPVLIAAATVDPFLNINTELDLEFARRLLRDPG